MKKKDITHEIAKVINDNIILLVNDNKMAKKHNVPKWYQLFVTRRIDKLTMALALLDSAEDNRSKNRFYFARLYLNKAKELI